MFRFLILSCFLSSCQSQVVKPTASPTVAAEQQGIVPVQSVTANWVAVPTKRVAVGQNIWFETVQTPEQALGTLVSEALQQVGSQGVVGNSLASALPKQPTISWQKRTPGIERRVIIDLEVVLQKGFLEHLISRNEAGKNHESLLSSPFDAEMLYLALVGAGLQPGKPAKFINEQREYDFKPATGEVVKVYLDYVNESGQSVVVPAQNWVVTAKEGKPLTADWVFAGSYRGVMETAQAEKHPFFGANDGRVVCLTNYGSALLDLPFESVDSDPQGDSLGYKANTPVIPKVETKVRAILEAAPKKK